VSVYLDSGVPNTGVGHAAGSAAFLAADIAGRMPALPTLPDRHCWL